MQNEAFGSCEEFEPRRMPKQASVFDSRPFPTVPEVSLIMEKPRQPPQQTSNTMSHTISELKPLGSDASYQISESYATWKEKHIPQHLTKVSSLTNPIFSSTQNASGLQNTHNVKYSSKPLNNTDHRDYNLRSQSPNDLPRKYIVSKHSEPVESLNRYPTSPTTNSNEANHYVNNSHDRISRFNNEQNKSPFSKYLREKQLAEEKKQRDEKRPTDERRWSDEKRPTDERRWSDEKRPMDERRWSEEKRPMDERRWSEEKRLMDERRWSNERRINDERDLTLTERRKLAEKRRSLQPSQAMETYNTNQTSRLHRSSSYPSANSYNHRNGPMEHDQQNYCTSLQPTHSNSGHFHHQSGCCTINHSNNNTETETVKNLLQVITSQNDQIKGLQKQVERLLKLHEQLLKNRNQCTCQPSNEVYYHNPHMYDQTRTPNLPLVRNNLIKENDRYYSDMNSQDEKTKKTILEQKVSIGVMTSFELKVQNNPSLIKDNEKPKSNQDKIKPNLDTSNMIKNLVNDTGEMIRKKPNFFLPTPLENISEGSESHMSSMRQSHLCSESARQSIEVQDFSEPPNAQQFNKRNFQNTEKIPSDLESTIQVNESRDITKQISTPNYKEQEPMYERNTNDIQEVPYQYNHQYQYQHFHSSPAENIQKDNKTDESEPITNDINKMKNIRFDNMADDCLSLSSSELDVEDLNPQSPEPSIHLDMQEFSSEGGSLPPQQATKVGWTIYNNVLNQVNQILQNSPMKDNRDQESPDGYENYEKNEYDNNVIMDTVKAATLDQLTKLGISFSDNLDQRKPGTSKKVIFETPYYQRQGTETHLAAGTVETNTSMHMKALAMKYLNDDQLAEMAFQKPQPPALKQVSNVQNTNLSFATMHYLQRYHLLPGNNSSPAKENVRENYRPEMMNHERLAMKNAERREPSPRRYPAYTGTSKGSCPSKILDISTLKQQPKLL